MIGCLGTRVRKQPIIVLYFESETVLKFYNLEAWYQEFRILALILITLFVESNESVCESSSIILGPSKSSVVAVGCPVNSNCNAEPWYSGHESKL